VHTLMLEALTWCGAAPKIAELRILADHKRSYNDLKSSRTCASSSPLEQCAEAQATAPTHQGHKSEMWRAAAVSDVMSESDLERLAQQGSGATTKRRRKVATTKVILDLDDGTPGLHFTSLPPDTSVVKSVESNSWAAGVGIEPGDSLVQIGDAAVQSMTADGFTQCMRKQRPLQLTFERRLRGKHGDAETDDTEACLPAKAYTYRTNSNQHVNKGAEDFEDAAVAIDKTKSFQRVGAFTIVADTAVQKLGWSSDSCPPDSVTVHHVIPGSWAADQGLIVGDQLVSLGAETVGAMTKKKDLIHYEAKAIAYDIPAHSRFKSTVKWIFHCVWPRKQQQWNITRQL